VLLFEPGDVNGLVTRIEQALTKTT